MTDSQKLTIQIVTWNSGQYLSTMLKSVFQQSFQDFRVLLIDNASRDGSLESVKAEYPTLNILRNSSNLGYSRAHNQGLQLQHTPYVLIMNPDVVLSPQFVAEAMKSMEGDDRVAAVCGKLKRFHFSDSDLREVVDDGIIDATGLLVKRSFEVRNRDAGERDGGQFETANETFGVSGACALYRRSALDQVMQNGMIFDETLFAYKEDVDLSWRLLRMGWRSRYQPTAVAYHFREAKDSVRTQHRAMARARKSKNALVNFLSYRNHAIVVLKNVPTKNILKHLGRYWWYELQKFLYLLIFERKTLGAIGDIIRALPRTLRLRRQLNQRATVGSDIIETWLT